MSSLAERLRDVIRPATAARAEPVRAAPAADAAEILGGEWRERGGHRFLIVDRKYSPGYRHGRMSVADGLPPPDGMWPRLPLLAGTACNGRLLFVDVETTGLAGGAGSYAFLFGCGWFEPPSSASQAGGQFRTRQFFLSSFAAEREVLEAVAEAADPAGTVVTFNGKSFDMPLIETRFLLHRMHTPFAGMPHVDMVHAARRLWRRTEEDLGGGPGARWGNSGGCRLATLEGTLCGHRREGDVPGFEIPSRYFHYVRSGDARPLGSVLEHNRLDVLALALLTARASQLLEDGPAAARTAREALGMGRLYERAGLEAEARAAFERATSMRDADAATQAEALQAYAVLSRRLRRYEDAAAAWRQILELHESPAAIVREATQALAVHHEHRLRDPLTARALALQSITLPQSAARREAVQHRLARLDRKLRAAAPDAISLF